MAKPAASPIYEIHVRGVLGGAVLDAFPTLSGVARDGDTFLTGELADQAALHGALTQIESFGLELVALQRIPSANHLRDHAVQSRRSSPEPR